MIAIPRARRLAERKSESALCVGLFLTYNRTREDIIMPLSAPIRSTDGSMMNEIHVPKGTDIIIGVTAANRNPALWGPGANEWKPERWLSPLPEALTQAHVPGIYANTCVSISYCSKTTDFLSFTGCHFLVAHARACKHSVRSSNPLPFTHALRHSGFKFSQLEMSTCNLSHIYRSVLNFHHRPTEVLIAVLVETFIFSESDQPIIWNVSGVAYPTVGTNPKASMPLRVSLAEKT